MRRHLTFSSVISMTALVISLGGVGYAAVKIPAGSVGAKQLKANAVTSAKVKDNSLTGKDINESKLGLVPAASVAGTATNATKLGGSSADSYLKGLDTLPTNGGLTGTYSDPEISATDGGQLVGFLNLCKNAGGVNMLNFSETVYTQGSMTGIEDSECTGTGGNTGLHIAKPGIYALTASVEWSADSAGARKLQIVKSISGNCDGSTGSGATTLGTSQIPPVGSGIETVQTLTAMTEIPGDLEVCVYPSAPGSTATVQDVAATSFSVQYLSPLPQ